MAEFPSNNLKAKFWRLRSKISFRKDSNRAASPLPSDDPTTFPLPRRRNVSPELARTVRAQIDALIRNSQTTQYTRGRPGFYVDSPAEFLDGSISATIRSPWKPSGIAASRSPGRCVDPSPVCSTCGRRSLGCRPLQVFAFSELQLATDAFSNDNFVANGENEFVFRGEMANQQTVAVKTSSNKSKFWTEIKILTFVRHPNIASLVGVCVEENLQMLVYEHACNGTLQWHLSGKNPNKLDWKARHKVAVQVARALYHLHEGCTYGYVIHGDIRPVNVFLSHDYAVKLGGFSSAKWRVDDGQEFGSPAHFASNRFGCAAPDNDESRFTSKEADVYAFGVLLLQLITGRSGTSDEERQILVSWARPRLNSSSSVLKELLDPCLREKFDHIGLNCMIQAAILCVEPNRSERGTMNQVFSFLTDSDILEKSFCSASDFSEGSYLSDQNERKFCQRQAMELRSRRYVSTGATGGGFSAQNKVSGDGESDELITARRKATITEADQGSSSSVRSEERQANMWKLRQELSVTEERAAEEQELDGRALHGLRGHDDPPQLNVEISAPPRLSSSSSSPSPSSQYYYNACHGKMAGKSLETFISPSLKYDHDYHDDANDFLHVDDVSCSTLPIPHNLDGVPSIEHSPLSQRSSSLPLSTPQVWTQSQRSWSFRYCSTQGQATTTYTRI